MIQMQSTILVILPTWAAFPLSLSLPPQILPKSTLSQRTVNKTQQNILRQPEAKHGFLCYIVRLRVIIKALLKQISLYLLSHFRIRIIALTCPYNKSARNHQRKSCVPAKIIQITMMRGQYYFNWNLRSLSVCCCSCEDSRVPDISIAALQRISTVDRNFVQNGETTPTHSSLCSWAHVSEQIANNVLFWLRLSKI